MQFVKLRTRALFLGGDAGVADQPGGKDDLPWFRRYFGVAHLLLADACTIRQVIRKRPFEQVAEWVTPVRLVEAVVGRAGASGQHLVFDLVAFLVLSDLLKPGIWPDKKAMMPFPALIGRPGLLRFRADGTLKRRLAVGGQGGGEGLKILLSLTRLKLSLTCLCV
jgi:hypothetical protein